MNRRDFLARSVATIGAAVPLTAASASLPCPAPDLTTGRNSVTTPCQIPGSSSPAWLRGIPVFQWVELPSLSASSELPNPRAPGIVGVAAVTDAWGGGALRQNGSYYILHGGGHGDYAGNEIYALQLSLDDPQWTRIWGPTPNSEIVPDQYYYNDSPPSPASIHSYYSLAFNDQDDFFMRFMRGQYLIPAFTHGIDGIKWGGTSWEQNQENSIWPLSPPGYNYANGQCKDSSGNVYLVNSWKRFVWNRQANSWSVAKGNSPYAVQGSGCCYDSRRNVIWSFGGSYGGGSVRAGQAYRWNLSSNSESLILLTGNYADSIDGLHANWSGAVYDPVADLVFVMTGDGYIYSFNPSNYDAERVITTGGPLPNTTTSSAIAPWGKLQYAPELGGVVIQPTWKSPTFFMRTH
jgi:hypothetical protein